MKEIKFPLKEKIRLDRYLRHNFSNATQGIIEKHLRIGKIRVNGDKAKSNIRLKENDVISLHDGIFLEKKKENKNFSSSAIALAKKILSKYLLFSSDNFIAIEKPHGLATQGGSKIDLSIDDAIKYLRYNNSLDYKLVHRLDKNTSGVLIIANGQQNSQKLCNAFKDGIIKKTYIALVSGFLKKNQGIVDNYIGKDRCGIYEKVKKLDAGGKRAVTCYKILNSDKENNNTLIEFNPKTGRMHQIRVHAKCLGVPIIGDCKYGGPKSRRLMLHAKSIIMPKTIFGRTIKVESLYDERIFTE